MYRQEKTTQAILDRFERQEKNIHALLDHVARQDGRLQQIEDLFEERFDRMIVYTKERTEDALGKFFSTSTTTAAPPQPPYDFQRPTSSMEQPLQVQGELTYLPSVAVLAGRRELVAEPPRPTAVPPPPVDVDLTDGSPDDDKDDGELSIPIDHSTAAHKLLRWPSIRNLLDPRECDEDYVMQLEMNRGLIRAFGSGEGFGRADDRDLDPHGASKDSVLPDGPSTSPRKQSIAGITEGGVLATDAETVRRYTLSYLEHMHKLHPFLDQSKLDPNVESFISKYCRSKETRTVDGDNSTLPRGTKRKLSGEEANGHRQVAKSVNNAITLLVMALGAICEWKDEPIPGPIGKYPLDLSKDPLFPSWSSSSTSTSFATTIAGEDDPMEQHQHAHSFPMANDRRHSTHPATATTVSEDAMAASPKNRDVIPGLGYYAYAAEILGDLHGEMSLANVQASLLAGLYAGQLAHPFQSHAWISRAGWACQGLIRPRDYARMQEGPHKDLHEFAFWTCLQLESDILAELDLPASGISRSENRIDLPSGRFTLSLPNEVRAPSTMMMIFYSAQIHLRKVLNRVHTDLYKTDKQEDQRSVTTVVPSVLSLNLDLWRMNLPAAMKWKDTDPPSEDINVARMRAKYYGARYIIYRPLLYQALHLPIYRTDDHSNNNNSNSNSNNNAQTSGSPTPSITTAAAGGDSPFVQGQQIPMIAYGKAWNGTPYRELPQKLRRACRVCVDSAIASTVSFDGVRGRPVVTNIFGTAHA